MNTIKLLLDKINCKDLETLKKWNDDNDDAFFDFFYDMMKSNIITEYEFNLILNLVADNSNKY